MIAQIFTVMICIPRIPHTAAHENEHRSYHKFDRQCMEWSNGWNCDAKATAVAEVIGGQHRPQQNVAQKSANHLTG